MIVEFHYRAADDFLLDVVHFNDVEMRERLLDLLRYYRAQHLDHVEARTEDAAALEALESQADLAEHTFKAMFRTPDLSELLGESEDAALNTLLRWQAASDPTISSGSTLYATQEQCEHALLGLSSEQRASDGKAEIRVSPWPYIKKIQ